MKNSSKMEQFHNARAITTSQRGFTDIFRREVGLSHRSGFTRRFSASEAVVESLILHGKLHGHEGSVNNVEFNSTGDILVSCSDDSQVMLWNWASSTKLLAYPSGHSFGVFYATIMPLSDDSRIVTSGGDGQVRLSLLSEGGRVETTLLGKHKGRVYQLALEPGSPHILYSCGQEGFVQHYDLRSCSATKLFRCCSTVGTYKRIGLNSIVIDPRNPYYFAIGGADEYARVYDIRRCRPGARIKPAKPVNTFCPHHIIESRNVNVTGLAYSRFSELLVSYADELVYLFDQNAGLGSSPSSVTSEDLKKIPEAQVYSGHRNIHEVKGVSFFGPNDDYVLSGSDCGNIFIWKKKGAKLMRLMAGDQHTLFRLVPHPHTPILATCGTEECVKIWAPTRCGIPPIPADVKTITESNGLKREEQWQSVLTPDALRHILGLFERQTSASTERRYNRNEIVTDVEGAESYILEFSDDDTSDDDDATGNSRDCNIS